jgi:hypothetical protein
MSRKWDETSKPIRCADCGSFDECDHICMAKKIPIENKNGWRYCYMGEPIPFDNRRDMLKDDE